MNMKKITPGEAETLCVYNDGKPEERVRRLMPCEMAVLQGFPHDWTDGIPHGDTSEVRLWGNGICMPTLLPMMLAMKEHINGGSYGIGD